MRRPFIASALAPLLFVVSAFASEVRVVTDARGNALPNTHVTITCADHKFDAISDLLGNVTIPDDCANAVITPDSGLRTPDSSATITVTATRTPTRVEETAASVVVLSRADLDVAPAANLDDVLRRVPGFTLFRRSGSRTANPTSQGVSLRGVGASGASRAVVLDDGLPLNDPFGGWVYWSRVPRESIDRVEVMRGGASDLYGSGSFGGVVNLIRKTDGAPAILLDSSYGSQSTSSNSLFANGTVGRWSASAAIDQFDTDGYINVASEQRGAVDTEVASTHRLFEATLERELASGRLFARGTRFTEDRDNGTPLQTNATDLWQWSGGFDFSGRFGASSTRLWTAQQDYDQTFSSIATDRSSERLTRVQRVESRADGVTSQLVKNVGKRHVIVAGVEGRRIDATNDEQVITNLVSLNIAAARQQLEGVFLEDVFTATSRLTLSAGARYDRWQNEDARIFSAGGWRRLPQRTDGSFSPRITARYALTSNIALFSSAYRAFRAPTLNELYRSFRVGNVLTLSNENLSAEKVLGAEGGVSFLSSDGRTSLRTALFVADVDDPVANVTLSATPALITRQRQNLGSTRSRGVELDAAQKLGALAIDLGYMFSDATVRDFPADPTLEGNRVPQTPRQQLTGSLRYDALRFGSYGLTGRWSDIQYEDDQNRLPLESYFVADVFASWPLRSFASLWVSGENVLDERYDIGRAGVRTIAPPRSVSAGVRIRWTKS